MERVKRILFNIPEFHQIPSAAKAVMLRVNVLEATALGIAKLGSFQDGLEQMRFCLGDHDAMVFMREYQAQISTITMKRITIFDINKGGHMMDSGLAKRFEELVLSIGNMVQNLEKFKLLMFFIILSNEHVQHPDIKKISDKYMYIFQRKLRHYFGIKDHAIMETFRVALGEIKELSRVLMVNVFANKEPQLVQSSVC